MKKQIKVYFRKLAREFFKKFIKVYWNEVVVTDGELLHTKGKVEDYAKRQIARRLAEQLIDEGMIDFEKRKDHRILSTIIRGKIRLI